MKHFLTLSLLILVTTNIFSQISSGEIKNYASKISDLKTGDYKGFWNVIRENNPDYKTLNDVRLRHTGTFQTAQGKYSNNEYNSRSGITQLFDLMELNDTSYCTNIVADLGMAEVIPDGSLCVLNLSDMNAFATFGGRIFIHKELRTKLTYEELLAAVSHEMAHHMLEHQLASEYFTARKEKRNKVWGEIASGLTMAAMATADAFNASTTGNTESIRAEKYTSIGQSIYNGALENAYHYHFRYSRKEETEADLIAALYLEYIGVGAQQVISMLEKLGTEYDSYYSKVSNHPKVSDRIKFINKNLELIKSISSKATRVFEPFSKKCYDKGIKAYGDENYEFAEINLRFALPFYRTPSVIMKYAHSLSNIGEYKQAINYYLKEKYDYIAEYPDKESTVYYLIAEAYENSDDYDNAKRYYSQAYNAETPFSEFALDIVNRQAFCLEQTSSSAAIQYMELIADKYLNYKGYKSDDCWTKEVNDSTLANLYFSISCIGERAKTKGNYSYFDNIESKYLIYAAKWGDEYCKEECIAKGYDLSNVPE